MTRFAITPEPLVPLSDGCRPADGMAPDRDLDGRWAAWLATGHANDVRMQRRMTWVAWLAGAGIVSWPAWAPALLSVVVPGHS